MENVKSYKIISKSPHKLYAKVMEYREEIPKHGWNVTVSIKRKMYEYPVIGRKRHVSKKGYVSYSNIYGDHKVYVGDREENYHFYLKGDQVVSTELLSKSDTEKFN